MIKHVLQSIPMYLLQALSPPRMVFISIERIFADFIWGLNSERKKKHWMSWKKICRPTSANGLGLNSLKDISTAYSYKLWWQFRTSSSLWGTFIRSKYKLKAALINNLQAPLSCSHTWRRVLQIKDQADHHIGVLVRNGESSYWHDQWLPCGRLAALYPLHPTNDLSVRDALASEDCRRILLQHSPWPVHLQQDQQDIYVWKLTSSGSFNLSSALQVINKGFSSSLSCKSIWHKEIPLSISIFMWRLCNRFLALDDVIRSFGFSLASWCFCKSSEESVDHTFLHCSFARSLWNFFSDMCALKSEN